MRLGLVHQHAAGAVHRLYGEVLAVDDRRVHILLVVVPVSGALPELAVENDGSGYLHVAVFLVDLAPIVDEGVLQHHALGQEEGEARTLVSHHEQTQLTAKLAVIALLRLFKTIQIGFKFLLFEKTCTVNSLEHFAVGIPAPIGAGAAHELYRVALDTAGAVQVRAGAEVRELALLIEADGRVLGQVLDELDLVGLVLLAHEGEGLLAGQLKALYGQLFLAYLAHLGLDLLEELRSKHGLGVKVVVKSVVYRRADGQLGIREQALHGLGEDVARRVAVGIAVFLVFKGVFLLVHVVPPEMKAPPRRVSGTGVRFLTHGSTLSLTLSTL